MKLLYLNHYAGIPALGMEYRPYYLAREWVRLGHRVQIVAADYSHVRARQPKPGEEVIDGIAYRWLPTPPYAGNGVGRMRNILAYLGALWRDAAYWAAEFRPDVVIASSTYPLDIWPARRIARMAGAKLVHEVHDLWPLSLIELSGMWRWHPFALVCQWAEDTACRDADRVVSILPKVHEHLAQRGLDLRKLRIVPNGVDPKEWEEELEPLDPQVASAIGAAQRAGQVVVGYAGAMGPPNALDALLDAASLLRDDAIAFILIGDGHLRRHLEQRVRAEALNRVILLPPIPKSQVAAYLARIQIAYIGLKRQPLFRFGISPNKLMDYMMAARPVLMAIEAGNNPVAEARCGFSVAAEDGAATAAGLRQLAALSAKERQAMGERGRAYVRSRHLYPVLARQFIEALQ